MIDLHSHTDISDGTDSPYQLVDRAISEGLEALAITDHDSLDGFEAAAPYAREKGFDLVCGIELSTKFHARTVHLLGYFLSAEGPSAEFRAWLCEEQEMRRDRNRRLIDRLNQLGVEITLEEVQSLGRSLTGRPHFARVLVDKGYVRTAQEAFDRYISEEGKAFVPRQEVPLTDSIAKVLQGNGIPVLAHPIRLGKRDLTEEEAWIAEAAHLGLKGIEVIHSDHAPKDVSRYRGYAARYGLLETGGSDFHGDIKPDIKLGSGRNRNVSVPRSMLDALRQTLVAA